MTKFNYQNVIVVGGTGFIGKKVALALTNFGFKTSVLCRKESLNKPVVDELKKHGISIVEGDLSKPETVVEAIAPFEAVISSTMLPEQEFVVIDALKSSKNLKVYVPSIWVLKTGKHQNILEGVKQKFIDATIQAKLPHILVYIAYFLDSPKFFGIHVHEGKVDVHGDGNQQIPSIHTDDVGLIMPYVLNDTSLLNKEIYLETCSYSTNEAIQWCEKQGKKLEITKISEKDLDETIQKAFNPFNFYLLFNSQYKKRVFFEKDDPVEIYNKKLTDLKFKGPEEYFTNLVHKKESIYKQE